MERERGEIEIENDGEKQSFVIALRTKQNMEAGEKDLRRHENIERRL